MTISSGDIKPLLMTVGEVRMRCESRRTEMFPSVEQRNRGRESNGRPCKSRDGARPPSSPYQEKWYPQACVRAAPSLRVSVHSRGMLRCLPDTIAYVADAFSCQA